MIVRFFNNTLCLIWPPNYCFLFFQNNFWEYTILSDAFENDGLCNFLDGWVGRRGGDKQSIMGDSEIDNNLKIW